jgi:hypothetical protein
MGRNKGSSIISLTVQRLIEDEAVKNNGMPRQALAEELQNRIGRMGQPVPSEDTLIKMISKARNVSELDKPWSVVTLAKNEIPPETLRNVLLMSALINQKEGRPITIREAKWTARLSPSLDDLNKLFHFVLEFTWAEKVLERRKEYLLEPVINDELYLAITNKRFNEPVVDKDGKEIPSSLLSGIQLNS